MSADLPPGWTRTTLGAVVKPPRAKASPMEHPDLPFVGMDQIAPNAMSLLGTTRFGDMKSNGGLFFDGDVLYGRMRPYLNKVHRAKFSGACSAEFIVFPKSDAINSDLLAYLLHHRKFVKFASSQSAGDRPRVDFDSLSNYSFALPPKSEQDRIVSKIDELFSRIDEGERALGQVQKLVERYRQSVLKVAVTGELTREWREQRKGQLESGEALLQRILKARREGWEQAELDKMKAKGIRPSNDKWKLKYVEPVAVDAGDQPVLPSGWVWASLDQLTTKITSGSRDWKTYYGRGDSVFVMAQNVRPRHLDLREVQHVDPPVGSRDAERSEIRQHDLLVTIVGANTGDACLVRMPLPRHYVCQSVALARPVESALSGFLELFLCADEGGQTRFAKVIYGAGRPHLSFDQLKALAVPLPPLEEQAAIADAVSLFESEIDSAETTVAAASGSAQSLRQGILSAAFSGQLVPQSRRTN